MDSKKNEVKKLNYLGSNNLPKTKPKSLKPMRSIVAVRSLKSKTQATKFTLNISNELSKEFP